MWGLKCSAIESEMNALDWSVWWGVERGGMEKERVRREVYRRGGATYTATAAAVDQRKCFYCSAYLLWNKEST